MSGPSCPFAKSGQFRPHPFLKNPLQISGFPRAAELDCRQARARARRRHKRFESASADRSVQKLFDLHSIHCSTDAAAVGHKPTTLGTKPSARVVANGGIWCYASAGLRRCAIVGTVLMRERVAGSSRTVLSWGGCLTLHAAREIKGIPDDSRCLPACLLAFQRSSYLSLTLVPQPCLLATHNSLPLVIWKRAFD